MAQQIVLDKKKLTINNTIHNRTCYEAKEYLFVRFKTFIFCINWLDYLFVEQVAWPSGLRRWFKAPVSSEAWVRIPPLPSTIFDAFKYYLYNKDVKTIMKTDIES